MKGAERRPSKTDRAADKAPPSPSGPLHVIVSIDKQRATLFDNGIPVASTAISTGTPDHPTPMGLFTVIQKSRHHVSNLYDAPMPYMQRITWSGSALHEGPLPGYPASHGCVRLTGNFAQLLWKTTKMGARVIITRPEVAPVEIEHARLFVPQPKVAFAPATTSGLVKTAETANATPVKFPVTDGAGRAPERAAAQTAVTVEPAEVKSAIAEAKPAATPGAPAPIIVDERPKTMPAAIVQEANRRPISVFVSLAENKLYVRQGWKPLFETPVTFEHPERAGWHPRLYRHGHEGRRQQPALDRGLDPEQHQARRGAQGHEQPKAPQRTGGQGRSGRHADAERRAPPSTASSCRRMRWNAFLS